jgi:hypothetical protein
MKNRLMNLIRWHRTVQAKKKKNFNVHLAMTSRLYLKHWPSRNAHCCEAWTSMTAQNSTSNKYDPSDSHQRRATRRHPITRLTRRGQVDRFVPGCILPKALNHQVSSVSWTITNSFGQTSIYSGCITKKASSPVPDIRHNRSHYQRLLPTRSATSHEQ